MGCHCHSRYSRLLLRHVVRPGGQRGSGLSRGRALAGQAKGIKMGTGTSTMVGMGPALRTGACATAPQQELAREREEGWELSLTCVVGAQWRASMGGLVVVESASADASGEVFEATAGEGFDVKESCRRLSRCK
jgi:hypothetical protein